MKIRTCRQSGRPVDPEAAAAKAEEWRTRYLVLENKHTIQPVDGEGIKFKPINILALQEDADKLEAELDAKYAHRGEEELPKNAKQWNALIKKIGSPLMVANPVDKPDDIIIVIVDIPLG